MLLPACAWICTAVGTSSNDDFSHELIYDGYRPKSYLCHVIARKAKGHISWPYYILGHCFYCRNNQDRNNQTNKSA